MQDDRMRLSSAEHTRLSLIRTGLKLFGENGFEGTTTREIARAAEANIGSISYHFGGKEGLRAACADYIVELLSEITGSALKTGGNDGASLTPQQARVVLMQVLETMTGFIAARPEAGLIVKFVLRELSHPTVALDRIYEGIFAPVHKRLCAVWEAATGEPAESDETKLTVFTLIGQLVYFRIAGEAVQRRMGWSQIGAREAASITAIAGSNLDAILAARTRRKETP
ncbi:CerR family C-terminal domain-containing protein [Nitratireductor kimnyeongensis]|uniref:CerR family C-terminal domain-containing protein n=1 Tax=Nitratireductor kimnyeongensis TaxID=430679 RepID=A0ABW0TE30_9HYPH|nr:CerR family C-terminal domain-containing protein [Nitratireductor kimnyeongensis]QZZ37171.1 CerR family C-terminal domain-containing protein [Nitratireductor kimnyeongensis]